MDRELWTCIDCKSDWPVDLDDYGDPLNQADTKCWQCEEEGIPLT